MKEIFLSASVPKAGRGNFEETADPFLIQFAVRELVTVCLGRRRIVWGGHPSITPMVQAICADFGQEFDAPVLLYQSEYFKDQFPKENRFFKTVVVPSVPGDLNASLTQLRRAMLSRPIANAVFIGGMEGIYEEYDLYKELHRADALPLPLGATGGASKDLAMKHEDRDLDRLDFARLFYERLNIDPNEPRVLA
ncbi:MAG: hypothetical protein HYX45_06565 [Burkholderiales bacterium]|nr:hypothetical protein [Burkholderiales bacterium]